MFFSFLGDEPPPDPRVANMSEKLGRTDRLIVNAIIGRGYEFMSAPRPTKAQNFPVATAAAKPSASTRGVYSKGGLGAV
jgi:hypothetical protein